MTTAMAPGDPRRAPVSPRTVWFDLETSGLDSERNSIIQIAAVAVEDSPGGSPGDVLDRFEIKLRFNLERAEPKALQMNSYDPEVWGRDAVVYDDGLEAFAQWVEGHRSVKRVSQRGSTYFVARGGGHNVCAFDGPWLLANYRRLNGGRGRFLALDVFQPLDTLQLARWWRHWYVPDGVGPENLKLETLCEYFGIDHDAHDALGDVLANAELAWRLRRAMEEKLPGLGS